MEIRKTKESQDHIKSNKHKQNDAIAITSAIIASIVIISYKLDDTLLNAHDEIVLAYGNSIF